MKNNNLESQSSLDTLNRVIPFNNNLSSRKQPETYPSQDILLLLFLISRT